MGGYSVITQDVLPFSTTVSERENRVFGANATGLERRGYASATMEDLQKALRLLTRAGLNTSRRRSSEFGRDDSSSAGTGRVAGIHLCLPSAAS